MKRTLFFVLIITALMANAQKGYRGYYLTGHIPEKENYFGMYLLASQDNMAAYINHLGVDTVSFLRAARRSNQQAGGQYYWLIDDWGIPLREIERGRREYNIFLLAHYQAKQLGRPFERVEGSKGQALVDSSGSLILSQKEEIINWIWTLDNNPQAPVDFPNNQSVITWADTNNLLTKWEILFQIFQEPFEP